MMGSYLGRHEHDRDPHRHAQPCPESNEATHMVDAASLSSSNRAMAKYTLSTCLMSSVMVVGCVSEDYFTAETESTLLADYTPNHRPSCYSGYPPIIEDMVFAMRVAAASSDYEAELAQEFSEVGYWPHPRDPFENAGTDVQRREALRVSRSVNPLEVRCRDVIVGGHGRANSLEHAHGGYFKEVIKLDDDGGGHYEVNRTQFISRMGTMFHEVMHTHSYKHKRHEHDSYDHSMPQITRHALQDVVWRAQEAQGTTTPPRSLDCATPPCPVADTMREYRDLGYLVFQKGGEPAPRVLFDPSRRGLGLMRYDTLHRELRLEDAQLHGQRYRRDRFVDFGDTWIGSNTDRVLAAGKLLPGTSGGEFLLGVNDGIVAVGWEPSAPGNFRQLRRSRWGDVLPSAAGPDWTLSPRDIVVGITDVRSPPSSVPTPPELQKSKEIVVQGGGGIAFLSAALNPGPRLSARVTLAPGAIVTNGTISWRFASDGRVLAVGDFTGSGLQDNVLVADSTGLVVIGHSTDGTSGSGPVRLQARHLGSSIGGWTWDRATNVVAVGDFDGDGADEWVMRSAQGIAIFGLTNTNTTNPGFVRLTQVFWNGILFGQPGDSLAPFRLRQDHQVRAGRVLNQDRDELVFTGGPELAVARLQNGLLRTGDAARILRVSSSDTHRVDAVADLDGDGFDELVVTAPRSSRIIERTAAGLQIQSQSVRFNRCADDNEACHDSLWGQWMVRQSDEVVAAIPDGNGAELVLAINRGGS